MKRGFLILFAAFFTFIISAFSYQKYLNWKIDSEKADVKFVMEAHGQELIGSFKSAKGDIVFDEKDVSKTSITCNIKVADINTGIDSRDKHLQSKDWFNAKQFPLITYKSDSVIVSGNGYIVYGKMMLKGTVKAIQIPFTFEKTADGATFKGEFVMKLSEFDIPKADDDDKDDLTVKLNIPVKENQ